MDHLAKVLDNLRVVDRDTLQLLLYIPRIQFKGIPTDRMGIHKINLRMTHHQAFEGSRDISLPVTYRLGASYRYDRYLGVADLVVVDDKLRLHTGLEASLQKLFRFRAGYMFNYDSKNLTAGASFTKRNLTVDYAFVPYSNDLGSTHLFNLTFSL